MMEGMITNTNPIDLSEYILEAKNIPQVKKKIKFEVTLEMEFPEDFDDGDIEYNLNEGSWCSDGLIFMLEKYSEEHGCICNICKAKVVNE